MYLITMETVQAYDPAGLNQSTVTFSMGIKIDSFHYFKDSTLEPKNTYEC